MRAITLREAHASVCLSGATSIARDSAQIILLDGRKPAKSAGWCDSAWFC